jgi:hypothetical protein
MTAQCPESLLIDGKPYWLESLPLEPLLYSLDPPPDFGRWIRTWASCLWRGYIGHWQIIDGKLFLTRLGTYDDDVDIDLDYLFPGRKPPIFASWYSGKLRVPVGDQLLYVHMGWQSRYERERILHVRHGHVVKERNVDHTERFLATVAQCPHLTSADGVIEGRGHNIPSLSWLTDEGQALVERRLGAVA